MRKWINKKIELIITQIVERVKKEVIYYQVSSLGVEGLERMLKEAKKNKKAVGHNSYTNLTSFYIKETERRKQL